MSEVKHDKLLESQASAILYSIHDVETLVDDLEVGGIDLFEKRDIIIDWLEEHTYMTHFCETTKPEMEKGDTRCEEPKQPS